MRQAFDRVFTSGLSGHMESSNFLFNDAGRLRSGWRLAIFTGVYLIALSFLGVLFRLALMLVPERVSQPFLASAWGWIVQAVLLFIPAVVVGWGCGALLEGLPFRALGWARHGGWLRDLLLGSLIGLSSLLLAGALAAAPGGFRFTFASTSVFPLVAKTLLAALVVFICAGAAEEALFRGYPLQTMTRAGLAWVGITLTCIFFGWVHLNNPNIPEGYALFSSPYLRVVNKLINIPFLNTALAGVWLGVAYLRTRSLWFPLGIHWAWNWTMGALLGLPVSGISELAPQPLMRAADQGPAWLTGGTYGIEGGLACTLVLIISTVFIHRTRFVSATEELRRLTDRENPAPSSRPMTVMGPPPDYLPPSP
jgi:membrane protease YdiL (CAAX protease family)